MKVQTAVRMLSPLARVERRKREYRATVAETGAVITFRAAGGRVTRVRVVRRDGRSWACRTLTAAVRRGTARGRTVPAGAMLLSALVERRGRAAVPVASFLVVTFADGPSRLGGRGAEWRDPEAVGMAEGVITGSVPAAAAVGWLRARGLDHTVN